MRWGMPYESVLRNNAEHILQESGAWAVCWPAAIISASLLVLYTAAIECLLSHGLHTSQGPVAWACGKSPEAPSLSFQTSRWMRQMYGHETRRSPMLFHPHLKALALLSFICVGQWVIFIFVLPNIFKMHIFVLLIAKNTDTTWFLKMGFFWGLLWTECLCPPETHMLLI